MKRLFWVATMALVILCFCASNALAGAYMTGQGQGYDSKDGIEMAPRGTFVRFCLKSPETPRNRLFPVRPNRGRLEFPRNRACVGEGQ